MSLLIEDPPSSLVDLMAQDSQLTDVAALENIDLSQKLVLAQEELKLELAGMLNSLSSMTGLIGVYQPFWVTPAAKVDNVAVTPALKLWHTYRTLASVYGDAYYSQMNDRYGAKRDQFAQKADELRERVIQQGIGIVRNPMPRGCAATLTAIPGAGLPDGTYYAAITWVNGSGEEGSCGPAGSITLSASMLAASAGTAPEGATGWNFYLSSTPEELMLQNTSPLAPGQVWHQPSTVQDGQPAGDGQAPNYMQPVPRVIQRG